MLFLLAFLKFPELKQEGNYWTIGQKEWEKEWEGTTDQCKDDILTKVKIPLQWSSRNIKKKKKGPSIGADILIEESPGNMHLSKETKFLLIKNSWKFSFHT